MNKIQAHAAVGNEIIVLLKLMNCTKQFEFAAAERKRLDQDEAQTASVILNS